MTLRQWLRLPKCEMQASLDQVHLAGEEEAREYLILLTALGFVDQISTKLFETIRKNIAPSP